MCGGGGGGAYGNDNTYWTNIWNDQRNQEAQRASQEAAAAEAEKAAARQTFNEKMQSAYGSGRGVISNYFTSRGINPGDDVINRALNDIYNNIPDLDTNPAKYYSDAAVGKYLDNEQQAQRDLYNNRVASTFKSGFENTLLPDSSVDSIVNSILGGQRESAMKSLDFNRSRGLLNDAGYNAALSNLDEQGAAGRKTIDELARSVLGTGRQRLTDIRGEAGNAASNYMFGSAAPDIGSFYQRAQDSAARDLSGLEGSIRGAVGTTNFFDVPTALQKGGTMQGPINLTTAGAPAFGEPKKSSTGRGLGSAGVF